MSSIFEEIDQQVNQSSSFWCPLETYVLQDITEKKLISTSLKFLKERDQWKTRKIILTTTCIYYCRKNTESPKYMSVIKWKKVEAFTEDNEIEERFGFKLGQGSACQEFYTENVEILEVWLSKLSKVAIMSELEEDFAVIKEIGRGNYACVTLVQDLESHEQFAVKSISKEYMSKKTRGVNAIISEIEIMKKIDHPALVGLKRVYENEEYVHLVLDFVEGGDLFHRIQKKEKFTEEICAKFITNMLEALKYLHSLNIVHRDIKPENILMVSNENDYDFKLCDFGLACIAGDDQVLRCGSPGYVAPEILLKKTYNNKVDIFSAGIILYIILSGRAPFYGKTHKEILERNKECRLNFHDKYWANTSKEGVDFVLKLTDPDPETRFSAEEALNHPWLRVTNRNQSVTLMIPSTDTNYGASPDAGASFNLMKRINDRREIGAEIHFENIKPFKKMQANLPDNKHAGTVLQKLREKDDALK